MRKTLNLRNLKTNHYEGRLNDYTVVVQVVNEAQAVVSILHRFGVTDRHAIPVSRVTTALDEISDRINKFFVRRGYEVELNYEYPVVIAS